MTPETVILSYIFACLLCYGLGVWSSGRLIRHYRARAAKEVEALKPYEKKNGYRF